MAWDQAPAGMGAFVPSAEDRRDTIVHSFNEWLDKGLLRHKRYSLQAICERCVM